VASHPSQTINRCVSVQDDWRAWLKDDKLAIYNILSQRLESQYSMFSVSLNEAIDLRLEGRVSRSYQVIGVTSALCRLLAEPLMSLLGALGDHARHFGTVPNCAPLDAANFHGGRGQRTARMSGILNRVLLSQRSQFLHKINVLRDMVESLASDFQSVADELAEGTTLEPLPLWERLDSAHYDVNTCLRETVVLLKSFLLAVHEEQLSSFQKSLDAHFRARQAPKASQARPTRHRRMTAIAGQ
jgi:hypothetical protein